mgnify:CR=1 FL=1
MSPERTDSRLLEAALDVTSSLDLQRILENFVERACALTGARYAGLSVLDTWGDTTMSVEFGDAPAGNASPDELPNELVERITDEGYVILNDPSLLENLPGFENFLGVSVTFQGQVYARLYLVNRLGGFGLSALRIVQTLASAAGIAVENAHLYADARRRARWIRASQQLTTSMLEGADEEEGLTLIAQTVREVSQADTAIIVLPSVKDTWAAEIIDGHHADRLLGVMFPPEGRAMSVLNEGTGMIVDSLARAQTMRIPEFTEFGPALYAPLRGRGKPAGVLILLRLPGKPEFDYSELALAESLAAQAALALELASARHAEDVASLLDERDRIGRDLHDFAIQQLFAAGMQLDATKQKVSEEQLEVSEVIHALDLSLASIDEAVRQIRAIVHNLREPDSNVGLVERIRRESSLSRSFLGFAPSLLISVDGQAVNEQAESEDCLVELVDSRVDDSRSDDAVAVVREGLSNIARHAHATAGAVSVDLHGDTNSGSLTVSIADDGVGIDPEHTRNSGLANMAERARLNGGTFILGTGLEGKGTRITWRVPLS